MEEIIKIVADKVGLPEDKDKLAVELVLNHVKGKLPAGMSGQIDSLVGGGGEGLGKVASSLGGILGK